MKPRSSKALKTRARKLLGGKYGFFVLVTLLVMFSEMALSYVLGLALPASPGILSLLIYLVSLVIVNTIYNVLLSGMYRIYLNLVEMKPYSYHDLLFAFSNHPELIAVYSLITTILELVYLSVLMPYLFSSPGILSISLGAVASIFMLWYSLTYTPVLILHASDPWHWNSARELMRDSRLLMSGHRHSLLWLWLTFTGVFLLAVLSLGIGMLFAIPYFTMSTVLFCRSLMDKAV